jgi:murein DD-endopeptidase MepM/ murein hydrolase activator NlpD
VTGVLRWVAMLSGGAIVWMVVAGDASGRIRLPVSRVVAGATVTQGFGCTNLELEPFDALCPSHHLHTGIDLAAPIGRDVHSATSGTVRLGVDPEGAGLYVAVIVGRHVRVLYCHLSKFQVRNGDVVSPGQVVGQLGSTGKSTGPHVHFEVQVDGKPADPAAWLTS